MVTKQKDMVARLYFTNGIFFVMATISVAYSSYVTHVELRCLVDPTKTYSTDSVGFEKSTYLAIYSSVSYGVFTLLTAIYTYGLLSFSSTMHVKRTLNHHIGLHGLSSLLSFLTMCSVSVYCHHHRLIGTHKGQNQECTGMIKRAILVWSPILIVLASSAFFGHLYVTLVTWRFKQGVQDKLSDQDVQEQADPEEKLIGIDGKKTIVMNVKNLVVRENRARLPSTRQYPGSPIIPMFKEDLLKP